MACASLGNPRRVALADRLGARMTSNLDDLIRACAGQMLLQHFERLKSKPSVDDDGRGRKITNHSEDRLIAGLPEQTVMCPIADSQMREKRLLDSVESEHEPTRLDGKRSAYGAFAGARFLSGPGLDYLSDLISADRRRRKSAHPSPNAPLPRPRRPRRRQCPAVGRAGQAEFAR